MIMAEEEVAMRLVLMRKPEQDHVYKWPCNFDEMHASTLFLLSAYTQLRIYAEFYAFICHCDRPSDVPGSEHLAILWKDGQSSSYWLVLWFLPYKATKTSRTQWGKSNYIKTPKKKPSWQHSNISGGGITVWGYFRSLDNVLKLKPWNPEGECLPSVHVQAGQWSEKHTSKSTFEWLKKRQNQD